MESLATLLILTSGLAHAVVNAIVKAGNDKMAGRALMDSFSALAVAPAAFLVPLPEGAWGWLAASWVAHLLYLVTLIRSYEMADMSVAYPIARGLAPMLAAGGAVLIFGEAITPAIVLGIAAIAVGVVLVGVSHRVDPRAVLWALLTGVTVASYTVIDARGVRAAPQALSYIVWVFLMLGGGIGMVFALLRGRRFIATALSQWRAGVVAGSLSIVTYGLALAAFRLGATPRLAALRETSILFAALIAVLFLGERIGRARATGIAAIAVGAIALIAAG